MAGEAVPQNDGALVVTAGQKVLVVAAPADTATTDEVGISFMTILNISNPHILERVPIHPFE